MDLRNVGKRFKSRLKTITGKSFYGQILDIPDTSRVSNFLSARRYLRVSPECKLSVGEVINLYDDNYFIAKHGTGLFINPIYKHFKMFLVDSIFSLKRITQTRDPITDVNNRSYENVNKTVYASIQPKADILSEVEIQSSRAIFVCNTEVKVDDILSDKWQVTKVDPQLGVYIVEAKEI